mmetsp:Transcript_32943/g.76990  ORF Transcript_32943/g.76990 Transcript_32943/m.76990 type:complete len:238 (+) Transcript_32943:1579-2292(+)
MAAQSTGTSLGSSPCSCVTSQMSSPLTWSSCSGSMHSSLACGESGPPSGESGSSVHESIAASVSLMCWLRYEKAGVPPVPCAPPLPLGRSTYCSMYERWRQRKSRTRRTHALKWSISVSACGSPSARIWRTKSRAEWRRTALRNSRCAEGMYSSNLDSIAPSSGELILTPRKASQQGSSVLIAPEAPHSLRRFCRSAMAAWRCLRWSCKSGSPGTSLESASSIRSCERSVPSLSSLS